MRSVKLTQDDQVRLKTKTLWENIRAKLIFKDRLEVISLPKTKSKLGNWGFQMK